MLAPSLAQKGQKTDPTALPGDIYGTRNAIFHLLRDEPEPQAPLEEDTAQHAPATVVAERDSGQRKIDPVPVTAPRATRAAANSDVSLVSDNAHTETDPSRKETEATASNDTGQMLGKARFREKQRVAKGTSARFTPKAASAPLVLSASRQIARAKPIKSAKSFDDIDGQTPLSPAAMAVLRGHLKVAANTDAPALHETLTFKLETVDTTPRPAEPKRNPLPLPRPTASAEALSQLFNEDHFEFQSASSAAALRERMEERRMRAAS